MEGKCDVSHKKHQYTIICPSNESLKITGLRLSAGSARSVLERKSTLTNCYICIIFQQLGLEQTVFHVGVSLVPDVDSAKLFKECKISEVSDSMATLDEA